VEGRKVGEKEEGEDEFPENLSAVPQGSFVSGKGATGTRAKVGAGGIAKRCHGREKIYRLRC